MALSVLWLLAVGASGIAVWRELNEGMDAALKEAARRILQLKAEDHSEMPNGYMMFHMPDGYMMYQLRNAAGEVVFRSYDAPNAPFPVPLQSGYFEADGQHFYSEAADGDGLYIQISERTGSRRAELAESVVWMMTPLLLLIPLAGATIRATIRWTIRPIAHARREIRMRGGDNLTPISDNTLPQELAPIIQDVNRLLHRLSRVVASERDFAANIAHELRTPLAAALAQTQRLDVQLANTSYRERVAQIGSMLRRLGTLVDKLLQLARAEAGIGLARTQVDLMPLLNVVVDEYARRTDVAGRLRFKDGGIGRWVTLADIDAIGIAIRNIIDNAFIHGPADMPVDLIVSAERRIHVVNGGPIVPPDTLAKLKSRFARGSTRTAGSGLGIPIADTIMGQCGGSLEIHSPAIGREDGFEVVLKFA